jgi:hypothetical protein
MAVSGQATVAYTYTPRYDADRRVYVEQRRTTALSSNCATADDAIADLYVLKPALVAGGDAAEVNDFIRAQGWQLVARA